MDNLPPFTHTPISAIESAHGTVVSKFHTHSTKPLAYRLKQLRSFYWALKDAEQLLLEAVALDLSKSAYEAYMTEVGWALNDILFMQKNLARFMKEEKAEDVDLMNSFMSPRIRKEPLGAVLIIGAFNFPLQLSLGPLVGAIAAGCTAVLKPSENAPNAARAMQAVIAKGLDQEAYQVVQGGVEETTALLDLKWNKIFYTGNAHVGKTIAKKAAETLTPVTLELGGKNPAIVTRNASLRLAARRLVWGKLMNAGQVCVSQNYTLVDQEVLDPFVRQLEAALREFHPKGSENNPDYGRIVNTKQFDRLNALLSSSSGKILYGGESDRETLYISPTIIQLSSASDPLLQDETFGPFFSILPVKDLDTAIATVNDIHATPLGLYAFGNSKETEAILSQTRSGGASINDAFYHASIPTLPFGGVGDSGQGSYRGRASFECFTHRRTVVTTPGWMEALLGVRYPPYSAGKLGQLKTLTGGRPDFDREGRSTGGVFWWFLGLGARKGSGAVGRWAVLVAVLAAVLKILKAKG